MVVEFELRRSRSFRVASIEARASWREGLLAPEFRELTAWAKSRKISTGRWIFVHRGDDRWEACLEIRGRAHPTSRIRLKTLPPVDVARCIFDPEEVADRVIYHGLSDWLRELRGGKRIKAVGGSREIYSGNPWSDRRAWARCEVQFVVRK